MPPEPSAPPPIRPAEQRALAAAAALHGEHVLCTTVGRAQAAHELARQRPEAVVSCWFLDEYQRQLAIAACVPWTTNLSLVCQPDLPEAPVELAVIPLSRQGEAELARDLLQSACTRLVLGGTLVAAVDNRNDRWLRQQLSELFSKVTVQPHEDAIAYVCRKTAEPRRLRDFHARFAFRDRGQLIQAVSRPGLFAHRRLDAGARQLLNATEVAPGMRVLDIGCGSGAISLALAAREPSVSVHAVDSNARAVECTLTGAALNSLSNLTAELNATGRYGQAGQFDFAVANPPYYADNRIAELFLRAAHRSLRSGGRVLVVAKHVEWYERVMPVDWEDIQHRPSKGYQLIAATRP